MSFNLDSFPFVSGLSLSATREKHSLLWLMQQAANTYGDGFLQACPQINSYAELLYAIGYEPMLTEDGSQLLEPDAPENQHITVLGENVGGRIVPTNLYGPQVGLVDGQMTLSFGGYTAPLSIISMEEKMADRQLSLYDVRCGLAIGNFNVTEKKRDDDSKITYLEVVFTIPPNEFCAESLEAVVGCNVRKEGGSYITLDNTATKRVLLNPSDILAPFGGGDFAIVGEYDSQSAIQTPAMKNGMPVMKDGKPVMTAFKAREILGKESMVTVEVKGLAVSRPTNPEKDKPFWSIRAHLTDNRMMALNSYAQSCIEGICLAGAGSGKEMDWLGIRDSLEKNLVFPFKVIIRASKNGASSNIILPEKTAKPALNFGRRTTPLVAPSPAKAALPPVDPVVDVNATLEQSGLDKLW